AFGCRGLSTYRAGPLSRLSSFVASRLGGEVSSQRSELSAHEFQKSFAGARAQTAVAAAAREAGAAAAAFRSLAQSPWQPLAAEKSEAAESKKQVAAGRLGFLPAEACEAARSGPAALHQFLVASGRLLPDPAQLQALEELSQVFLDLRLRLNVAGTKAESLHEGLYLHGHVGTGKTLLMDIFLASVCEGLPAVRIHRTHLHEFLQAAHAELHRSRSADASRDDDVCPQES
ncbi:unnamed protein product, partial [Polarella glacialis]